MRPRESKVKVDGVAVGALAPNLAASRSLGSLMLG